MPFYNFEELCWSEFNIFERQKSIILVPIAPLEEHGHHLPFGVDVYNSEYFCKQAGLEFSFENPEYNIICYPALAIGCDCFRFPGSIDISQKGIYQIVKSIGKNFNSYGFKNIVFVGLHGGPKHIAALENATIFLNRFYRMNTIAPFGRVLIEMFTKKKFANIAMGREITDDEWEKFQRDIHAGFIETSLMLYHHPHLVRDNFKIQKNYPLKIVEMRRHPFGRFSNWDGQLGYPSLASKEIGETISKNMINWFKNLLKDWVERKNTIKKYKRSIVSKVLVFNVNFKSWMILFFLLIVLLIFFLLR